MRKLFVEIRLNQPLALRDILIGMYDKEGANAGMRELVHQCVCSDSPSDNGGGTEVNRRFDEGQAQQS